jgi:hypothetical protein
MIASTYIGGTGFDKGNAVMETSNGDIVVAGVSSSANYPLQPVPIRVLMPAFMM